MNWKKAVTIGTAALCTVAFNGCVVAPANGYAQPYGPVYVPPPVVAPNVYIGPRPLPYYQLQVAPYWTAPRYAPPVPHWGGGGWGRGGGWHHR